MRDLNLGLNDPANAITKQDANVAGGYVGLNSNKQMDASLIPLDYRKSQGYIFDGIDDYLTIPHNDRLNFGADDFSIQCCFTISPSSRDERIAQKVSSISPYVGFSLVKSSDNSLAFRIGTIELSTRVILARVVRTTSYNLIAVRSEGLIKCYLDGILVGTNAEITIGSINNSENLFIGSGGTTDYLSGKISLLRLFNRGLSQADVAYYNNSGRPELCRLQYADVITDYGELMRFGNNENFLKGTLYSEDSPGLVSTYIRNNISPINGLYDGRLQVTAAGTPRTRPLIDFSIAHKAGKSYMFSCKAQVNSGTVVISEVGKGSGAVVLNKTLTTGINKIIFYGSMKSNLTSFYLYFDGTKLFDVQLDDYSVTQLGCVLELLPENAQPTQWLETQNGLHPIALGSPAINTELMITDMQLIDNVTNNIEVNVFNKDFVLPAGYAVTDVYVRSSVALSNLRLVQVEFGGVRIDNEQIQPNITKRIMVGTQYVSDSNTTLRLNATGNVGSGFNIIIDIKKCI